MLAAESGHVDTVELLLGHQADANESNLVSSITYIGYYTV